MTNTYTPGKTNVSGVKIWNDEEDQDGIRPDSITIRLLADGKETDAKTVTAADGWKWNFKDLDISKDGKEITYSIAEDAVKGYKSVVDVYNVTNTHVPETTEVSVTKTWDDEDDQDGRRPQNITINLLADGKETESLTVTENGCIPSIRYRDTESPDLHLRRSVSPVSFPRQELPEVPGTRETEKSSCTL